MSHQPSASELLANSTPGTATSSQPIVAQQPNPDGLEDSEPINDVFVESTWRGRAVKYDREQQSEPVTTKEAASQAKQMVSSGCQTESLSVRELKPDSALPSSFAPFLSRVYPELSAQLEANLESHAFDDYLVAWDEERDAFENVFTLSHVAAINELGQPAASAATQNTSTSKKKGSRSNQPPPLEEHAACLSCSWSCNGSVLVASYGSSAHPGWCNHSAATLSFWNIMRRQISSTKPDFALEQDCCCMCVAYHPERPTILAGGMFNGEVRIWDISLVEDMQSSSHSTQTEQEEKQQSPADGGSSSTHPPPTESRNPCIMRSSIEDAFHREPVTRVEWVRDSMKNWQLVSVSGDGKILFWPVDDVNNKLQYPTDGYILAPTEKYSGQKQQGAQGGNQGGRNKFAVLGGTAIGFPPSTGFSSGAATDAAAPQVQGSHSTPGSFFLAATEGGGVLRLPLSTILKRKGYLKSGDSKWHRDAYRLIEQSDPVAKFELKKGIEKYAKSIGAEAIELSTVFDSHPSPSSLYPTSIEWSYESHSGPVYGMGFCAFEKNIFATASTDGRVKVFQGGNAKPLLTLQPGSEYLFSLVWSPSRPLVFAVSDADGRVYIYDLVASMLAPSLILPVNADRTPIQTISWNVKEPALLACADMKGRVSVFNLSAKYYKMQPGEKRLMEQIANAGNRK